MSLVIQPCPTNRPFSMNSHNSISDITFFIAVPFYEVGVLVRGYLTMRMIQTERLLNSNQSILAVLYLLFLIWDSYAQESELVTHKHLKTRKKRFLTYVESQIGFLSPPL